MNKFTRAAQALSDETRLRILNILLHQECCVCEVMQALEISQTRASRNLKVLNDSGFLSMRTEGLYTLYSPCRFEDGDFHEYMMEAIGKAMSQNAVAQADVSRLHEAMRVGPGCEPKGRVPRCITA